MDFQKIFSQRVFELRSSFGVKQEDIATALHLTKATVSRWESGNRLPAFDVAVALADYFNVSLDYLVGRTDNPEVSQ